MVNVNGNKRELPVSGLTEKQKKQTIPKIQLDAQIGILPDIAHDLSIRHTRASWTSSAIAYCNLAFLAATNCTRSCGYQDVGFVWGMIRKNGGLRNHSLKGCLAPGSSIPLLALSW